MITKIIIDNFMAHEHTELMLGPGVTILTGSNNTGKSAVVEALRCLATNPVPSHVIRHGAKEARVEVVLDDGTRVAWIRTKRWAKYELWAPGAEEPEEYNKLQRKVPEDVARVLRLDQVELETRKGAVDVHLGNQRDPVFLFNQPDSVMAEFFAASTESAHLLAMQNALKMRVRDAKREERALMDQTDRVGLDLDRLAPLPDIARRMEEAEDLERDATGLEQAIPALEGGLTEHRALVAALDRERAAGAVLEAIQPPPPVQDVDRLKRYIASMGTVSAQRGRAARTAGTLAGLATPPDTADTAPLRHLLRDLALTGATLHRASIHQAAMAGLAVPPAPENTSRLAGLVDELYVLRARNKRLARLEAVLGKIAEPPVPAPLDGLGGMVAELAGLINKISERQAELNGLETDLRSVVVAMDERIQAIGCCPVCGGDLTTDSFLDHGCRHDA
ncbi:DNA replication and repair protein RecF [Pseudodesulfovibrio hydrargyri]|uniref:DNA repair protein RecN n=1 Tax=Pseudodesulfovibrio hydrargyri TaxID=2125990 RepID=A0A1J5MT20_9BACT|nr:AAA family ATPase [Pseudodesulfovibrio hydrargyri]OIQ49765.1 DNA replication and repair protein RecF [Pseudodesulfovibrio hydrargyri]